MIVVKIRIHTSDLKYTETLSEVPNNRTEVNRRGQYIANRTECDYVEIFDINYNCLVGTYFPQ